MPFCKHFIEYPIGIHNHVDYYSLKYNDYYFYYNNLKKNNSNKKNILIFFDI